MTISIHDVYVWYMSLTNDYSIDQPGFIIPKHTRQVGANLMIGAERQKMTKLISFPQLQKIFISHISSIFNIIHLQREL